MLGRVGCQPLDSPTHSIGLGVHGPLLKLVWGAVWGEQAEHLAMVDSMPVITFLLDRWAPRRHQAFL